MGHQALSVSGLVLFFLILVAHFGSKLADERDRQRPALALAVLAALIAAAIVVWEIVMFDSDGLAIRRPLTVGWALVALLLVRRVLALALDIRGKAAWEKAGRRRPGGY